MQPPGPPSTHTRGANLTFSTIPARCTPEFRGSLCPRDCVAHSCGTCVARVPFEDDMKTERSRRKVNGRLPAVGISNRETPAEEEAERQAHPPVDPASPPPEDAGGDVGERRYDNTGRQTSHKAGSRSVAQKEAGSKYADRSMPAARKVAGAYARESKEGTKRDRAASLHAARPAGNSRTAARRRSS